MIVTNDSEVAKTCRILRDHGMSADKRYWHEVVGFNYRMTNIQAALGVAQMRKIDKIIARKKDIAKKYEKQLKDIKGITLPPNKNWADSVFWLYTILIDDNVLKCSIDSLMSDLKSMDIDSRPVFPPMHQQPIYITEQSLPVAEKISAIGLTLPSSPSITNDEIKIVCNAIKKMICDKSDSTLKCNSVV